MFDDDKRQLSAAAQLDEEHWQAHLRKVAEDLTAIEPLEALRRSPPAPASEARRRHAKATRRLALRARPKDP